MASTPRIRPRRELRGFSIVPLVTPFRADGAVDEPAVRRLVDHVIAGGCQAMMVSGTTGEAASMSLALRLTLIEVAVKHAAGRAVVFAGIGDNSFAQSVALAHGAFSAGADAVVAHLPSYYPIGPVDIEAYFQALVAQVDGPMYLYNIPQTTRLSIPLEVVERLSRDPRIPGIKDSEPDAARQEQVAAQFAGREDFAVFCGSIGFTATALRAGADGYVPSVGNIAPRLTREAMDRWFAGDITGAGQALQRMTAISAVYQKGRTLGESLRRLKAALEAQALGSRHMLPPLRDCTDADVADVRAQLQRENVIP